MWNKEVCEEAPEGMMIPPENRRKSISNISSLVSEYNQGTVNRAFHGIDSPLLEQSYIKFLKTVIGNHSVMSIGDDTMPGHPGSNAIEYVGWFFDHASGSNVPARQPVTSGLYDINTDAFYPFLTGLYLKKAQSKKEFKTKLEIMEDIFNTAENNFNVSGKVVNSWYSGIKFPGNNYVTELKSNRKASFYDMGWMIRNSDLFYTMDEIIESTLIMHERDSDTLKEFPFQREFTVYLSNGNPVNLIILYNPDNKRKKFIASDYLPYIFI